MGNVKNIWSCGLYIRLSREDGDKLESESVKSQRDMLEEYLKKHIDLDYGDTYIDDGYSGTNFDRPNFKRLLDDIKLKKINCVIVKDLSRLGRNHIETGNYVEIVFPMLNIRFISINDQIDSFQNPQSVNNITVAFKNLINDEYCRDISLKVRSALNARRENGMYIGSFAPYGYLKDPNDRHKLVIDEYASENVKEIFRLFLAGKSINNIANYFNKIKILTPSLYKKTIGLNDNHFKKYSCQLWTSTAIRRILTNQVYIGNMIQKKMEVVSYKIRKCRLVENNDNIVVLNTHTPIISIEDFDRVQTLLKRDVRISTTTNNLDILSGFCKCGDCKRSMHKKHIKSGNKDYYYFICSTFKNNGKEFCSKHTIRYEKVINAVLTIIKTYINIALIMDNTLSFIEKQKGKLTLENRFVKERELKQREKDKIKKSLLELYPDYKDGLINKEIYLELKNKYEKQLVELEKLILKLNDKIDNFNKNNLLQNQFITNFLKYKNIVKLDRNIITELIDNIFIYEGNRIVVDFKFKDEYKSALDFIESNKEILPKDLKNKVLVV